MTPSPEQLEPLAALAIEAAQEAGALIARSRPQHVQHKEGGSSLASQVLTEVDRRSQEIILRRLAPTLPRFDLGVLAEEREDDGERLTKDCFWCVDPLDGTLSFIEATPGYAVSIALVSRDGAPLIGVVHDPVRSTLYHAIAGQGVFRDRRPWAVASQPRGSVLSVFADRSFLDWEGHDRTVAGLERICPRLGLTGVEVHLEGGAVMNACRVLEHPPACYFKPPKPQDGGGSLWDYAATACLFHEAGAVATDIHGAPLELNRAESTFMNHRGVLFATDDELAAMIRGLR